MIAVDDPKLLDAALAILPRASAPRGVRGRFISLYFGLRRMRAERPGVIATLGSDKVTSARDIQKYLDRLYAKSHRPEPFVVLTSPFGGSQAPGAPYSARSGSTVAGRRSPVNTWRNNFGIQKGVGCPASARTINNLLNDPQHRLACPHMVSLASAGQYRCGIRNTAYRGEEHAIWLRRSGRGYQVVDLDHEIVFQDYLKPNNRTLPVFPLIAMLYCMSEPDVFPSRQRVGIPEFAEDFGFRIDQLRDLFDCEPESPLNSEILSDVMDVSVGDRNQHQQLDAGSGGLPQEPLDSTLNTGVGAELLIAEDLQQSGWRVRYRGNQPLLGYDLEASRDEQQIFVEVKSSIAFANLELQESEWMAAQRHRDLFVLAVVDFFGSDCPRVWYVRNPAANANPDERTTVTYRFSRTQVEPLKTEVEFL